MTPAATTATATKTQKIFGLTPERSEMQRVEVYHGEKPSLPFTRLDAPRLQVELSAFGRATTFGGAQRRTFGRTTSDDASAGVSRARRLR
ncbi:hypothetical protein CH261_16215 [Rhodococcus sp. 05-2254-3]|nr:hypothetical protein CH261_16215 [Rhodococcus sp. 05-2254-3]